MHIIIVWSCPAIITKKTNKKKTNNAAVSVDIFALRINIEDSQFYI